MTDLALKRTPLYEEHVKLGAKMVPFAGYEMPVQYPTGVMAEHKWTREHAGLFDVSHMGQCLITGNFVEAAARALEKIVPADLLNMKPLQQRYTQLLNAEGGILDDLMISRVPAENGFYVVLNAGRKEVDRAHLSQKLDKGISVAVLDRSYALLAIQGPKSVDILAQYNTHVHEMSFMTCERMMIKDIVVQVSRSGYSGEDGFEISVLSVDAVNLWQLLLKNENVKPIGLGARDSLRLEAGLCLYGHDIDETTSPVEADLTWSIGKRRRAEGGFIGADRVLKEIAEGPKRKRVGIKPDGRAPAREGTVVLDMTSREIGKITSGGFGPTVNGPVAMGYVETASAAPGTAVQLVVRGQAMPATIVKLPFVPNRFKR
jgi:aminomethyltransferase